MNSKIDNNCNTFMNELNNCKKETAIFDFPLSELICMKHIIKFNECINKFNKKWEQRYSK